jgi:hypothetical protein
VHNAISQMKPQILQLFFILTSLFGGCTKKDIEFTNQLDNCAYVDKSIITKPYQVGTVTVKLPSDWRVRPKETAEYKGIEAADTVEFTHSLKILTFTINEFQADKSDLLDYFKSEIALMKVDTMKFGIIEKGTISIDRKESFYVITSDTIQGFVLHQLFVYAANRDKFYTIQVGSSGMQYPTNEFCKYLWLVDSIQFQ